MRAKRVGCPRRGGCKNGGRVSMPYVGGRIRRRKGEGLDTVIKGAIAIGKKILPRIIGLFKKGRKAYKMGKKFYDENPEIAKIGKKAYDLIKSKKNGVTQKPNSPEVIANQNMNDMPLATNMKSNPAEKVITDNDRAAFEKKVREDPYTKWAGIGIKSGGRKRRRGRPCGGGRPRKGRKGRGFRVGVSKFGGALMRGPIA